MLARRVAKQIPDAEWNAGIMDRLLEQELAKQQLTGNPSAKLTPEEIVDAGRTFMKERQLGEVPFRRYER